jgi:phosphoserine phosphatase RsbU/P
MAAPTPTSEPRPQQTNASAQRVRSVWDRVSEGFALADLWTQFKTEARSGYQLYSREMPREELEGKSRGERVRKVAGALFWAILNKLSPARRVVLLIGIFLLIMPMVRLDYGSFVVDSETLHTGGGFVILGLFLLEVADRVTLKRDLQIAREIQTWLIPQSAPPVPGLDVAFFNRPANTVAGDYYDVFQRKIGDGEEGPFLIAVADVAGKSLPAALLMATFHASLHTLSAQPGSVAELTGALNRFACEHSSGGQRFTTAFLAEYDPGSGTLTYVNAGHNAPILQHPGGAMERLEKGGLPLGIMTGTSYESGQVTVLAGDKLVVFTDGLVEAVNSAGEEYGEGRLFANLLANRDCDATETVARMTRVLDSFVGMTAQHDDITCLVARRS